MKQWQWLHAGAQKWKCVWLKLKQKHWLLGLSDRQCSLEEEVTGFSLLNVWPLKTSLKHEQTGLHTNLMELQRRFKESWRRGKRKNCGERVKGGRGGGEAAVLLCVQEEGEGRKTCCWPSEWGCRSGGGGGGGVQQQQHMVPISQLWTEECRRMRGQEQAAIWRH